MKRNEFNIHSFVFFCIISFFKYINEITTLLSYPIILVLHIMFVIHVLLWTWVYTQKRTMYLQYSTEALSLWRLNISNLEIYHLPQVMYNEDGSWICYSSLLLLLWHHLITFTLSLNLSSLLPCGWQCYLVLVYTLLCHSQVERQAMSMEVLFSYIHQSTYKIYMTLYIYKYSLKWIVQCNMYVSTK